MKYKEQTVTQCLEDIGVFGRFQLFLASQYILTSMMSGYITFQFQSLSVVPPIICNSLQCEESLSSGVPDTEMMCSLKSPGDWTFGGDKNNWLTEFSLYCDRMYIISMGTSVYFLGFFMTVSLLSSIVDKFGRKLSTAAFLLTTALALVLLMVSNSVIQILLVRFMLGALHGGQSISFFVTFYEFSSANIATLCMMLSSAGFSMGGGLSGLAAMVSPHWQATMIPAIVVYVIASILFQLLVPESPHWLFAKGYESQALHSLNRVARYNGAEQLKDIELVSVTGEVTTSKKSQGFSILFRTDFLRSSLLSLAVCWFTVAICYYGLEFNAGSLGNEYVVMMLMGCFDFPFKIVMYVFAGRAGRQFSCQVYLGLALVCLICSAIPQTELFTFYGNFSLKTILVASGRAFGGSVFAMLYIYTSEILPTLVRSLGVSFCSTAARVGSLLAPLVILVNQISPAIIYIFIVVCICVSMLLLRNIPETLGKQLPNNLEDCKVLFARQKKKSDKMMPVSQQTLIN